MRKGLSELLKDCHKGIMDMYDGSPISGWTLSEMWGVQLSTVRMRAYYMRRNGLFVPEIVYTNNDITGELCPRCLKSGVKAQLLSEDEYVWCGECGYDKWWSENVETLATSAEIA